MFDGRPERIPVERTAELSEMTFLAIASPERAVSEINGPVPLVPAHVQAARPVAAFAADVHQFFRAEFPAIPRGAAKTDGVTTDAFGIGVGLAVHQRCLLYTSPSPRDS